MLSIINKHKRRWWWAWLVHRHFLLQCNKKNTLKDDNKFGCFIIVFCGICTKWIWQGAKDEPNSLSSSKCMNKKRKQWWANTLPTHYRLQPIKRKEEDNEPSWLIIILYFNAIKQKDDDKLNWFVIVCSPSTRPRRQQQTWLAHHHLLRNLHIMKMMTSLTCHCLLNAWTKKEDDEPTFIVVFSRCIETR